MRHAPSTVALRNLAAGPPMTSLMLPRLIAPGSIYLVSRRTTQRMFLMRPSRKVNRAIRYCLARAVARSGVVVHLAVFLSNHYHIIVSDPDGNLPVFTEELNKLLARCLNLLHTHWENFWAGGTQPSYVSLEDAAAVLAKSVYCVLNPVEGGLVKSWRDWPGVLLVQPGKYTAKRPDFFFRSEEDGGKLPKVASFELTAPPIESTDKASMHTLIRVADAWQRRIVAYRKRRRLGFLGPKRIRAQRVTDTPTSREPRRGLSPRVACRDRWRRIEALLRNRDFVNAHRTARQSWERGDRSVVFPPGTYLMRVRHGAACAPLPDS